ncbi:MAG: Ni/Fe hydrogenase subunit alpha [Acidobacteriia bacterium]|nr:Ni/Fe hydrogenase subunit alpha [Terriglobia bacterium]
MTRTIAVNHLARVEGHGGVTVVLDGDRIERLEFDIFEGLRLFEGLVVGRTADEIPAIVSRICAICSHGHTVAALRALEDALGVHVSRKARMLRDLSFQGQNIESHALHVFVLALPDVLGHPSVISLAAVAPDVVATALRLKKLGNSIQEVTGGRAVHPVNHVIGGFGRFPTLDEMLVLRRDLEAGVEDCKRVIDVLAGIRMPEFVSEPIRVAALVPEDDAFFFGNEIALSTGERIPVADYRSLTNERVALHSTAKHSEHRGRSYMVGSLARLTLHGERIGGLAREAWERIGFRLPSSNIVANNVAQAVEMIYSVEQALRVVNRLLEEGLEPEAPAPYRMRASSGAAAVEVPRGTLFHSYTLDAGGKVLAADVITPTAQNLLNAEDQMRATVRDAKGATDDEIRHRLEIVARAYDPCISCSVHVVRT